MTECQIQVKIGTTWLDVGDIVTAAQGWARLTRQAWIDSASRDNGPDAAQYVRSHTRIIRRTVTEKTEVVES